MKQCYETAGWQDYDMDFKKPYTELESLKEEINAVDGALDALQDGGILSGTDYSLRKMEAHRQAVRKNFVVPWTAITPRLERLLYAINSIAQPKIMVALGIFCGFTFISNAGAALGSGSCYLADRLIGIEIDPESAKLAQRNVSAVDVKQHAEIITADGIQWLETFNTPINLLYLDATAPGPKGKTLYLDLLKIAIPNLHPGSLVLAHNSVNSADMLGEYLDYVRDPNRFSQSMNVILDTMGLEVSRR